MADNSDTPEGSLDELMQALAKYNRANKAQKQKLGGTGAFRMQGNSIRR
jgi:hypothetical protein